MAEHLPHISKALGSIPNTEENKNKNKKSLDLM
jgi:hypothetical protein